eukprot:gnl/TRDRNA2_/TRDRNA2_129784_c0_seq1.p1 gnl/TRDRNA2_/TRDRNA2_129784_c0~~gnl/TRDRNA2_/TRDRNA2_129784_c0_seq1.p1  ORF type:complete len:327 (+),score=37.97 gnl/TRDRNA2_/TRDRNA2_129784_c0_seq1:99-1079(+)
MADNDFDDAAHRLFAQLGIGRNELQSLATHYHNLDCVYESPENGARVYIGNIDAARSLETLDKHKITRIVNCQDPTSANFHENNPRFKYLRFPIAWWQRAKGMDTPEGVLRFFHPLFSWVDEALAARENVMIHCLAGAHRAGTSGVAVVMHLTKGPAATALLETKKKRPAVDPIMSLGDLLLRLDRAMESIRDNHGKGRGSQQVMARGPGGPGLTTPPTSSTSAGSAGSQALWGTERSASHNSTGSRGQPIRSVGPAVGAVAGGAPATHGAAPNYSRGLQSTGQRLATLGRCGLQPLPSGAPAATGAAPQLAVPGTLQQVSRRPTN